METSTIHPSQLDDAEVAAAGKVALLQQADVKLPVVGCVWSSRTLRL